MSVLRGGRAEEGEPRRRLLVFVISYYAEKTLRRVLERIPAEIFATYDTEILVVDDASTDRTFEIGHEYKEAHAEIRMTVLRNEYNQGYGGNQKVGYTFAIERGFDFVAMVHGDGQYAPERLPELVLPLALDRADAVFGSRMITPLGALKGGMPLYKYVGNKILTRAQNFLLGADLSEFHSGYRVYSVAALARIPFRLNANDFHFDTEIIIQLLNAKLRIVELPVPTFYGDEISRVNGMRYAADVMKATVKNVFHRAGLLYQRRFDPAPDDEARYELKLGYTSSHSLALDAVPRGAKVLDFDSKPASFARALEDKGCEVEVRPAAEDRTAGLERFDHILLLDVLEHVASPERFLAELRAHLAHQPKRLILTTPNIAFLVPRVMLLLGQFNYGRAGILDRTHTRLFTFRSLKQLLEDEGFKIRVLKGVPAPFPEALGHGLSGRAAVLLNELLIGTWRELFAYQIYVEAESTPGVAFLVRDAVERSGQRAARLARLSSSSRPR